MYKKFVAIMLLLTLVSVPSVFAYGIGLQLDGQPGGSGFGYGPSVTFKLDQYPIIFAANLSVRDGDLSLGVSGDYWLFNDPISASLPFKWFLGYGAYIGLSLADELGLSAGGRLPVGINAFFKDGFIEPYIQIVPSVGIIFSPSFEFPDWSIPVSIGVRFWF